MNTKQIKTLLELLGDDAQPEQTGTSYPWELGKVYFIRTVTYHLTGRIKWVGNMELVVTEAAWIADSGRFADALKNEEFDEVEPFPVGSEVIIGRQSVIDAVQVSNPQVSQK
jgi:hypothetical protein